MTTLDARFAAGTVAGWVHDALEINGLHPHHEGTSRVVARFGGRIVVVTVTTRRDNTELP